MLIEFSVTNYRSISERQTLNLIAQKTNDNKSNVMTMDESGKIEVVRSAAIYGPNASGKSNLISAITKMASIIVGSAIKNKSTDDIHVTPFKLDKTYLNKPSEFEITFIQDNIRYQYGFSATKKQIIEEWLFAYPKGRLQRWFGRSWDEEIEDYQWDLGNSLMGEKQTWLKSTRNNALFLSTAVQLNSQQLKPIYDWFYYKFKFAEYSGWSSDFSAEQCQTEEKRNIMRFLKAADIGIDDIHVTKEKFNPNDLPDDMPQAIKDLVIKNMQDEDNFIVKTMHKDTNGEPVAFDLEDESEGTRKIFSYAGPLSHSLKNGNVIFIDELNDNLHPKLVEFLVSLFNDPTVNKNNSQLIFTTHETSILSQKIFRRDQIWFVEKDKENATKLFPLTDFSPRKSRENLELSYLDGRYGALPFIRKLGEI